jgi:hypothetical protein
MMKTAGTICVGMILAAGAPLALPATAPAFAASKTAAPHKAAKKPKITVRKHTWRGYGFLPGYPRSARERRRDMAREMAPERRYFTWDGRMTYGFGQPGFYRGQYNGGSFGPCWTSTPIGLQWNCGR